ncbi:serine hydrolase [soil metagenome]
MTEALETALLPLVETFSGRVAVAFQNFQTAESYTLNATTAFAAASLIKLPLLVHALSEVARGRLELEQRYPLQDTDRVGGAGVLHVLAGGLEPTLHDLLTLMIVVSDNTATNLVIDILGLDAANAFIQNLGLAQTRLVGKLQLPEEQQNEAQRRGLCNATCAADMLGLLVRLERRELLPDALTSSALTILEKQQFTEALARYLPTDEELNSEYVVVASKSGCLRGLWHDAGLVYSAAGTPLYSLVVMTEGSADRSYSFEQEGMMLIARLSKQTYDLTKSV